MAPPGQAVAADDRGRISCGALRGGNHRDHRSGDAGGTVSTVSVRQALTGAGRFGIRLRSHSCPPRGGARHAVRAGDSRSVQALCSGLGSGSWWIDLWRCREGGLRVGLVEAPARSAGWAARELVVGVSGPPGEVGCHGWGDADGVVADGSASDVDPDDGSVFVPVVSGSSALPAVGVGGVLDDLAGGTAGWLTVEPLGVRGLVRGVAGDVEGGRCQRGVGLRGECQPAVGVRQCGRQEYGPVVGFQVLVGGPAGDAAELGGGLCRGCCAVMVPAWVASTPSRTVIEVAQPPFSWRYTQWPAVTIMAAPASTRCHANGCRSAR